MSGFRLPAAGWRVDFEDPERSFAAKTNFELARSLLIFNVCAVPPLVQNASILYKAATRALGQQLPDTVIRASFFRHFCGGESESDLMPVMKRLGDNGVGAILDYAAEADVDSAPRGDHAAHPEYAGEADCDFNAAIVVSSIDAAAVAAERGGMEPFAACKMTALGRPELLERLSAILNSLSASFSRLDTDGTGQLTAAKFIDGLQRAGSTLNAEQLASIFRDLDLNADGMVEYADWMDGLMASSDGNLAPCSLFSNAFEPIAGPAYKTLADGAFEPLSQEEAQQYSRMLARADDIAQHAASKGVKLLIDAEQTYMQPAIDHLALLLMQRHNAERAIIFNTYQCYLKDAPQRVAKDMERAARQGFVFAAKAVRGAYMVQERRLAAERGYESPIHETKEATHECYDRVIDAILTSKVAGAESARTRAAAVMVASRNEESVLKTLARMHELGLEPADGIFFAQLQGMCDHVSYALGQEGYAVYKYLPYGPVKEVMPYLLRRLEENSDIMGTMGKQRRMMWTELKRRATSWSSAVLGHSATAVKVNAVSDGLRRAADRR